MPKLATKAPPSAPQLATTVLLKKCPIRPISLHLATSNVKVPLSKLFSTVNIACCIAEEADSAWL